MSPKENKVVLATLPTYAQTHSCVGALVYSGLNDATVYYSTYVQPSNCVCALVYSEFNGATMYSGLLYLCTTPQLCRCSSVQ